MTTLAQAFDRAPRSGLIDRISIALYRKPWLLLIILLAPPLGWLIVVYLGSLLALLAQSFFSLDGFTGQVTREFTWSTYAEALGEANRAVLLRSVTMAALVTIACALLAFPLAESMARRVGPATKAALAVAVMVPMWSSYLVKVYAWKLILAKEGVISWFAALSGTQALVDAYLALPVVGGPSFSLSLTGTFLVFVYLWLPYMVLPIAAALERIPRSLTEASQDLGAAPRQTFRRVVLPLALPGVAAGSIFTFSLTLGDYIAPGIIGTSAPFLGQVVQAQQGTAGNVPLAAALTVLPILVMGLYLWGAKRVGAFDAL